jgi:hypothetical protein
MRRREVDLWPGQRSLWPVLVLIFLVVGLTACGEGSPEPAEAGDTEVAASGRQAPAALAPLSPVGEVVLADGFSFAWELPEGAEGGIFSIAVFAGGSDALWKSPQMTFTEFEAPPALLLKLQPGRTYTWRVMGSLNSGGRGRGPDTRFSTR